MRPSGGAAEGQRRIAQAVVHALSVHAVAEEELLYPMIRKPSDGGHLVEDVLFQHQEAQELPDRIDCEIRRPRTSERRGTS